jgi:beta-galactosidase
MYPKVEYLDRLGNHEEIKIGVVDRITNMFIADNKPLKPEWYIGKPVVLCEYAHAMENSLGNFQEYMDRFEKYKNMAGGFIWDFVDQSIHRLDENGQDMWLYGGDFEEEDTHRYFCANGIVSANRKPHPSIYEVKKVYQEIKVHPVDLLQGRIKIQNKYAFTDLSEFTLEWEMTEDGVLIQSGEIEELNINARESGEIDLGYKTPEVKSESEYHLLVSFKLKSDRPWAKAGYEMAWDQFKLPFESGIRQIEKIKEQGILIVNNDDKQVRIKGKPCRLPFCMHPIFLS